MSSKHKIHLIQAEAVNVTTLCGKISTDGGVGSDIRHFTSTDGGEFYAARNTSLVSCGNCCAKKGWRA